MKTTIPIVIGLVLLVILVVKEPRPDIAQEEKSTGVLAVEYEQEARDISRLEAANRAIAVAEAFTDSWSMAEFQSSEIEFFRYIEEIDSRVLDLGEGQVVREILIKGRPVFEGMVPLETKMWIDLKHHIKVPGYPEVYLRARTEQKSKYGKGLVRLSDVAPPVYGLAPWTDSIPRDRLEDGGKLRVVARYISLLKPGQTTEELIFPLPAGKCEWYVNSDETITVDVNDMKFTATDGEDISSRKAQRDDRIVMLDVTLGRDVNRPQTPVEFVVREYI